MVRAVTETFDAQLRNTNSGIGMMRTLPVTPQMATSAAQLHKGLQSLHNLFRMVVSVIRFMLSERDSAAHRLVTQQRQLQGILEEHAQMLREQEFEIAKIWTVLNGLGTVGDQDEGTAVDLRCDETLM
jgi:2-polyprenyl-6-methoxyphenol hydroxylase-like FAD-dependent oxidoreductase